MSLWTGTFPTIGPAMGSLGPWTTFLPTSPPVIFLPKEFS